MKLLIGLLLLLIAFLLYGGMQKPCEFNGMWTVGLIALGGLVLVFTGLCKR